MIGGTAQTLSSGGVQGCWQSRLCLENIAVKPHQEVNARAWLLKENRVYLILYVMREPSIGSLFLCSVLLVPKADSLPG
jgi:hypothetical protein